MGSQYCVMQKTALPDQLKLSVLTAEIRRRLLNMDQRNDDVEVVDVINKFDEKMQRSGYQKKDRREVTEDANKGHLRNWKDAENIKLTHIEMELKAFMRGR